ncbi:MAG: stage II sporulation protein P [Clostridia bacterium]|nr:stage II sporulation protein P [Clostridia bacterium]
MIKIITKTALGFISFIGFSLITASAVLNPPTLSVINNITATGLGILPPSTYSAFNSTITPEPYKYINLPKDIGTPAGIEYYNTLSKEDITIEGQDPTPEPPQQEPPLPTNSFPIISLDMSDNQKPNDLKYKNESKYSPDINELLKREYPLDYTKSVSSNNEIQPLVLIIHTHGSECYSPEGVQAYTADTPTRVLDTASNVVAVGKVLADELNARGVHTIHCTTMFDAESYSDSYNLSEKAVKEYLAKYPSIQYVFDIHRDSITRANNEKIKPLTKVNGTPTAQAMFVVGTDSGGANHPNWLDNLTVASHFQNKLIEKYGNIMRPINLRKASFNAEHAPGSLLIEVGSCGNTLSEAKNCALLLGETIAEIILTDGKA